MGFQSGADEAGQKSMEDMVMNEVKRVFNPEFLNRLDESDYFQIRSATRICSVLLICWWAS